MDDVAALVLAPPDPSRPSASSFTVLTWNIDGLDPGNLVERSRAIEDFIRRTRPDVVLLQEVVPTSLAAMRRIPGYLVNAPRAEIQSYFCAVMLKLDTVRCRSIAVDDFEGSEMGRYLLTASVDLCGANVFLLTAHLESTVNRSTERKAQLARAFAKMRECGYGTCILGGDLNLRDAEARSVGVPDGVHDAWVTCGEKLDRKYTWDRSVNDNLGPFQPRVRCRFDRVYVGARIEVADFDLVGRERLPSCDRFPSDHFGILCTLQVD